MENLDAITFPSAIIGDSMSFHVKEAMKQDTMIAAQRQGSQSQSCCNAGNRAKINFAVTAAR